MKKSSRGTYYLIGAAVIAALVLMWAGSRSSPEAAKTIVDPSNLPGIQIGNAPWPAEITHLKERLNGIGLPVLSGEGTVLHTHQHLDILIDGNPIPVPAGVGINQAAGFISPVHVHDNTNVVHVESPTVQTYTLGQFFDIWGVKFTSQCVGGYCNGGGKTLKLFVNGAPYAGNPRELSLESHQEIAVTYGTDEELPKPIPSVYLFPAGQ